MNCMIKIYFTNPIIANDGRVLQEWTTFFHCRKVVHLLYCIQKKGGLTMLSDRIETLFTLLQCNNTDIARYVGCRRYACIIAVCGMISDHIPFNVRHAVDRDCSVFIIHHVAEII